MGRTHSYNDALQAIADQVGAHTVAIVAVRGDVADFEMIGDVDVMVVAMRDIGKDLHNDQIIERFKEEAIDGL